MFRFLSSVIPILITTNVSLWGVAKGLYVEKKEGERSGKVAVFLFSKEKKDTKMHFIILITNIIIIIIELSPRLANYVNSRVTFSQIILDISNQICQKWPGILLGISIIVLLIVLSMLLIYRAVNIIPTKSDEDGNRRLNATEIDKEYIDFSRLDRIDGHSTLLIIAGDLSFLGDIPDIKSGFSIKSQRRCKEFLSDNTPEHSCCKRNCPKKMKNKCIEKSEQFKQLFELRNRGIALHIICKQPNISNDIPYKRRLGRLKQIFKDDLEIRFFPYDTLENGICVLGRIKVNGGIKELFWHWKDPEHPGVYIVPDIKRIDSSENKTLIYLLEKVLWEASNSTDNEKIKEYINKYEEAIN